MSCNCRVMKGGVIMASTRGKVSPLRRKMMGGAALLLNPTATVFTGIPEKDPMDLSRTTSMSGRGALKTDLTKVTEKLDRLMLSAPKKVKKNIRVSL